MVISPSGNPSVSSIELSAYSGGPPVPFRVDLYKHGVIVGGCNSPSQGGTPIILHYQDVQADKIVVKIRSTYWLTNLNINEIKVKQSGHAASPRMGTTTGPQLDRRSPSSQGSPHSRESVTPGMPGPALIVNGSLDVPPVQKEHETRPPLQCLTVLLAKHPASMLEFPRGPMAGAKQGPMATESKACNPPVIDHGVVAPNRSIRHGAKYTLVCRGGRKQYLICVNGKLSSLPICDPGSNQFDMIWLSTVVVVVAVVVVVMVVVKSRIAKERVVNEGVVKEGVVNEGVVNEGVVEEGVVLRERVVKEGSC